MLPLGFQSQPKEPMNPITQVVAVNPDDEVVFHVRSKETTKDIPFLKFGKGTKNKVGQSMSITQAMLSLADNVNATWLFWKLESLRDLKTNIAVLPRKSLSKAEEKYLERGFPILQEKQMVKRVKQNTYLINPSLVVPYNSYPEVKAHWDSLDAPTEERPATGS